MYPWQQSFIIIAVINIFLFVKGFYESHKKKNAYGEIFFLGPLGIFVWGDAVVFGTFWALTAITTYFLPLSEKDLTGTSSYINISTTTRSGLFTRH